MVNIFEKMILGQAVVPFLKIFCFAIILNYKKLQKQFKELPCTFRDVNISEPSEGKLQL